MSTPVRSAEPGPPSGHGPAPSGDLPQAGDEAAEPASPQIPDDGASVPARSGVMANPEVRQFLKFCIVGASSTVITFAILNFCKYKLDLPLVTSLTVAFLLSVANGFYWNRRWTFKKARANSAHEQSLKFMAVNLVGYLLNTSIVVLIVAHSLAGGHGLLGDWTQVRAILYNILAGEGKQHYPPVLVNGAQAVAVCIVVWWNFFANRLWTFKH